VGVKRKQHSAEFKARVAMAALSGEKTLAELTAEFGVRPTTISNWKQELVKRAGELFDAMPRRCCEFVDSRLRRSPPDRASAVPDKQAEENATRFSHLAHRSAAAHKLHSTPQQDRMNLISGNRETSSRLPALAYSPRKLSKRPAPSQYLLPIHRYTGAPKPHQGPFG
jgi:transposase